MLKQPRATHGSASAALVNRQAMLAARGVPVDCRVASARFASSLMVAARFSGAGDQTLGSTTAAPSIVLRGWT